MSSSLLQTSMQIAGYELAEDCFPRHLGIIMDGNGRWAKQRGVSRNHGHRAGMQTLKKILEVIDKTPTSIVTLYCFSKENWKRSKEELDGLWNLLRQFYRSEFPTLKKRGVRIVHSGDTRDLAADIIQIIDKMVGETRENPGKVLNLALNYSGRDEMTRAVARLISSGVSADQVTEEMLAANLDHPELGDMDLLIRTSGELRVSNFSLWQLAYTEFYFTEVYWPDFKERHLAEAIHAYQQRERRFGGREPASA